VSSPEFTRPPGQKVRRHRVTNDPRHPLSLGLGGNPEKQDRLLKVFLRSQSLGKHSPINGFLQNGLGDEDLASHFPGPFLEREEADDLLKRPADGLQEIAVSFLFSEEGMLGNHRLYERGDKEGEENGLRDGFPSLYQLIHEAEEGQKKVSVFLFRGISVSEDPLEVGEEGKEQARLKHQLERGLGSPFLQVAKELVPDTGGRAFLDLVTVFHNGLDGLRVDREACPRGMTDNADHPDRVLLEPLVRVADGSDDSPPEIFHSPHTVDDRKIRDVVKKTVNRDVAAQGIFLRGAEALCPDDLPVFVLGLLKLGLTAEGGNLDNLSPFEKDVDQTESSADHPAVSEEVPDLLGMGVGGNVEVLWSLSQEEITDTPSHQIGQKAVPAEAIEDLECLFVNPLPGDRMF